MKIYKLYSIKETNGMWQLMYVTQIMAANIVEAEFLLEKDMLIGNEYQITVSK